MGEIKRYRPSFFTEFENKTRRFYSLDELLKIEWVNNFRISDDFYRFSYHSQNYSEKYKAYKYILMAEYKEGFEWWVVGFVTDSDIIKELPIWEGKTTKALNLV